MAEKNLEKLIALGILLGKGNSYGVPHWARVWRHRISQALTWVTGSGLFLLIPGPFFFHQRTWLWTWLAVKNIWHLILELTSLLLVPILSTALNINPDPEPRTHTSVVECDSVPWVLKDIQMCVCLYRDTFYHIYPWVTQIGDFTVCCR